MQREQEFTGKKVQDAVQSGLDALGLKLDDVEVHIVSNGGLFKKAKVILCYDDGLTEEQAAEEEKRKADEEKRKAEEKRKESENDIVRAQQVPADEPHWSGAPVKREPSVSSDFGNRNENKRAPRANKPRENAGADKRETAAKPKKPRESVLPTEEQMQFAKTFLTELLERMHIEGSVEISVDEGMRVNVDTEDARIIGHRGEVLDAMQQLISAQINTSHGKFVHITVDGLGYRDRRKDSLQNLARRMADKSARTHRKVALEPMNSADRRIIHAALGEREDVFTRSEGHDPARRVVIIPKRK